MSRYNTRPFAMLNGCIVLLSALLMNACVDEIPGYGDYNIPEGEVSVDIQSAFSPFSEAVLSRSSEIHGNAMQDLSDLCLIAYDTDGNLIVNDYFPNGVMEIGFDPANIKEYNDEKRDDVDASNGHKAEVSTKCLNKTVTLPTGRYYLIAVANLGDYLRNDDGSITTVTKTYDALTKVKGQYYGKFATLDNLRSMLVNWNLDNAANNREMLGYFTDSRKNVPSHSSYFTPVVVNRAGMILHTWLRRCASKVTIDFDGTDLRENVRVYIKEARIYDIPKTCTLGFGRGGRWRD